MLCNDIVLVGKQIRITELFFDVIGNYCLDRGSTKMSYDWALNITEKYIFINAAFFANHHVTVAISNCKKKTPKNQEKRLEGNWLSSSFFSKLCENLCKPRLNYVNYTHHHYLYFFPCKPLQFQNLFQVFNLSVVYFRIFEQFQNEWIHVLISWVST